MAHIIYLVSGLHLFAITAARVTSYFHPCVPTAEQQTFSCYHYLPDYLLVKV